MPSAGNSAPSVAAQSARGHRSALLSHAVRVLCKIVSVLVLARLVSPADHGLYAMAASLTLLLTLFRDLGLGAAAVQAPELDEDERTTLHWAHLALGGALAALTLALIPTLVWFYEKPALVPLTALMSVSFLFIGLNAWPRVLLARELRFPALNRLETQSVLLATGAMIATGAAGGGAYAFAVFLLVSEFWITLAAWRACAWRPRGRCRWRRLGPLLHTGLPLTFHHVVAHLGGALPILALGRWFGATPLGFYNRSAQLLALPIQHVATPLAQVLHAALARTDRRAPDFAGQLRNTARLILHLTLPVAVLCLALPAETCRLVLGPDWIDAAPFLRWLAVGAIVNALGATLYPLGVALGRSRRLAAIGLVTLLASGAALVVARDAGAVGLVQALVVVQTILLLPRLWWLTRQSPVRVTDYLAAAAGPFALAAALFAGLTLGATLAAPLAWSGRLLAAATGAGLCAGLLTALWPKLRHELHEVWWHRPRLRDLQSSNTETVP